MHLYNVNIAADSRLSFVTKLCNNYLAEKFKIT